MKAIKNNNKGTNKNCGNLTPQSPAYLQGIPASAGMTAASSRHCGRLLSGVEAYPQSTSYLQEIPASAGMTAASSRHCGLDPQSPANKEQHDKLIFRSFLKKIFSVAGVFFLMCFFSNEMYAQKSKEKQREEVLVQLESQTKTFLATIETKLEENQIKKKALETELANLLTLKTKKKSEREANEQKMESLRKKIALLEDKEKEYLRMKNEIVENFESILDIYRKASINN